MISLSDILNFFKCPVKPHLKQRLSNVKEGDIYVSYTYFRDGHEFSHSDVKDAREIGITDGFEKEANYYYVVKQITDLGIELETYNNSNKYFEGQCKYVSTNFLDNCYFSHRIERCDKIDDRDLERIHSTLIQD